MLTSTFTRRKPIPHLRPLVVVCSTVQAVSGAAHRKYQQLTRRRGRNSSPSSRRSGRTAPADVHTHSTKHTFCSFTQSEKK